MHGIEKTTSVQKSLCFDSTSAAERLYSKSKTTNNMNKKDIAVALHGWSLTLPDNIPESCNPITANYFYSYNDSNIYGCMNQQWQVDKNGRPPVHSFMTIV